MSRRRTVVGAAAAMAALAGIAVVAAQSASGTYDLSYRALFGGSKAVGGQFEAQSAVGQPLAGSSSGGQYTLSSGFFSGGNEKYRRYAPHLAKDGTN